MEGVKWSAVESHISPNTGEIWGTQDPRSGQCFGAGPRAGSAYGSMGRLV
jgi:hypothetical protein